MICVWAYTTGLNEPNLKAVWQVAEPDARCTEREPTTMRGPAELCLNHVC